MPPHLMQSNSRLSMGSPPPPPPHPSSQGPSPDINIDQMHLMARQNNLFHFGDVTVSNHPDTQPVPMVVPMVYLCPLPVKQTKGKTKHSLLVPRYSNPYKVVYELQMGTNWSATGCLSQWEVPMEHLWGPYSQWEALSLVHLPPASPITSKSRQGRKKTLLLHRQQPQHLWI